MATNTHCAKVCSTPYSQVASYPLILFTLTTSLLTFTLGSVAGQTLPALTAAAPLLLGGLLVLLLLGLLALVPPVGALLSRPSAAHPADHRPRKSGIFQQGHTQQKAPCDSRQDTG